MTLRIGKIGAPFGVKGAVKFWPSFGDAELMQSWKQWQLGTSEALFKVEELRPHNGGCWVVKLAGVNDCDAAKLLCHQAVAIPDAVLPTLPAEEYYWQDLEGLNVQAPDGTPMGVVSHLYEAGGCDVMVVALNGQDSHIPFWLGEVVTSVHLSERYMVVDWTAPA